LTIKSKGLQTYTFTQWETKQQHGQKRNRGTVAKSGAEFFLEMKESSPTVHANKEASRSVVPRTRACCRVTATGSVYCHWSQRAEHTLTDRFTDWLAVAV